MNAFPQVVDQGYGPLYDTFLPKGCGIRSKPLDLHNLTVLLPFLQ